MGTLFAARLGVFKKYEIWLLDNNTRRAAFTKKTGLRVIGLSEKTIKPSQLRITSNPKKIGTADLIIFFVKSFDTQDAVRQIIPCVGSNTVILTLQNGIGNAEAIEKVLKKHSKNAPILAGTTSEAATYINPGAVEHTGKGETAFGYYCGTKISRSMIEKIAGIFNSAGVKSKTVLNVKSQLWSKLVLNSAINPLGALTLRKNGELLKDKCLKELLFAVANESANVAGKKGIKLLYKNPLT